MAKRPGYDWERIEADYRTGKYTLRELSAMHGPANPVIDRRAKKYGWTKDLSLAVRQATKAAVIESVVAEQVAEGSAKVADSVKVVAQINRGVIESHRGLAQKLKGIVAQLAEELGEANEAATLVDREVIEAAAEQAGCTPQAVGKLLAAAEIERRAGVADKLAAAAAKLVPLERKAHGLDEDGAENLFDEWIREQGL